MNMISTAFPTEMNASNKQSSLVSKLVTAWEKKNSKAARAGGVSLMALSLAACGAEDETAAFSQADIEAATAAGVASVDITSDNAAVIATATAAGVASVDITSDNAAVIATATAAGVASVDITSDNAAVIATATAAGVASVDVTSDNAAAVNLALRNAAAEAGAVTFDGLTDAALLAAIKTADNDGLADAAVAALGLTGITTLTELSAGYTAAVTPAATNFVLTTAVDGVSSFTGGAENDTFVSTLTFTGDARATTSTLNAGDVIDGGAGADTYTVTITGAAVTNAGEIVNVVASNVEKLHVRNFETDASGIAGAGATIQQDSVEFDLANVTGLTEIGVIASNNVEADTVFANAPLVANVVHAGHGDTRVEFTAAAIAGAADSITLTLNDAGTSATDTAAINMNGVETVSVVSTTAANFLTLEDGGYTTVNTSGASALNIEVADTAVTVFSAADATGAVTADLSAITTSGLTSVVGGTGSTDTLVLGGAGVSVTGTGTLNDLDKMSAFETLAIDTAHAVTLSSTASGFNSFDFTTATDQTLTLNTGYTGATSVSITGDVTNGDTITNTANVALTVSANLADLDGTITGGTGTDTINATVDGATQTLATTITGVEVINVTSSATAGTDGGITTVNANVAAAKAMEVNASTLSSTEVFTFDGSAETNGSFTVRGGAAIDIITGGSGADTIYGGAGNDSTLSGGAGNDTIYGDAGDDTITAGTGDDTIYGGTGKDTIVLAGNLTAADTIDGGDGVDILQTSSISAAVLAGVTNVETLQLTTAATATLTADLAFDTIDLKTSAADETVIFSTGYLKAMTVSVEAADVVTNTAADIVLTVTADSDDLASGDNTLLTGANLSGVVNTLTVTNTTGTIDMQTDIAGFDVLNIVDHATTAGNDLGVDLTGYGASGEALTVNAATLDTGEVFTITGASTANLTVNAGAAKDVLVLGTGTDVINAGGGNDTITAGTNITYADVIDGGDGTDTMTASTLNDVDLMYVSNVENLTIDGTSTLGAYASIAAIAKVTVTGGDSITGTGMTTGVTYVGDALSNNDTLTGGSGNDTFSFAGVAGLEDADAVDGTSGTDSISFDNSLGRVVAGVDLDDISNIDKIIAADADGFSVSQNDTINIDIVANSLAAANTIEIDMSAITDSNDDVIMTNAGSANAFTAYTITGGAGDDIIIAGAAADTITGGGGADNIDAGAGKDTMTGGAGADTYNFASADSKFGAEDNITDFATTSDKINVVMTMTNVTFNGNLNTSTTGVNMNSYLTNTEDGEAVYDSANGVLQVDLNGDASYNNNDLFITAGTVAATDIYYTVSGTAGADTITLNSAANGADFVHIVAATGSEATAEDTINNFSTNDVVIVTGTESAADEFKTAIDVGDTTAGQWQDANGSTIEVILFSDAATTAVTAANWDEDNYQFGMSGAVYQMAASSEVLGSNNADHITAGATDAGIRGGQGADQTAGGGGTDTFIQTDSLGYGVDTITVFTSGTDIIHLNLSDIEGLADVTEMVNLDGGSASAGAMVGVGAAITAAYDLNSGDNDEFLTVANIANAQELETALEVGGDYVITTDQTLTAGDAIIVG